MVRRVSSQSSSGEPDTVTLKAKDERVGEGSIFQHVLAIHLPRIFSPQGEKVSMDSRSEGHLPPTPLPFPQPFLASKGGLIGICGIWRGVVVSGYVQCQVNFRGAGGRVGRGIECVT